MTTRFAYLPIVTPTVIAEVADGARAAAIFARGGMIGPSEATSSGSQTLGPNDRAFLKGCAAAMPDEPLFNRLVSLIDADGSINLTWSVT